MTTLIATQSQAPSSGFSRVTLSRTETKDVQQRQIHARIDDGSRYTLMFGDVVPIDIAPGTHTLHANNSLFWKRVTFLVEAGQHVEFALINGTGKLALGLLVRSAFRSRRH